jgi:leader peptidase (prepilin peptidase) / N-methyltransferase
MTAEPLEGRRPRPMPLWAIFLAASLAVATVVHLGFSANALAWAVVQIVLVGVAAYDISTRLVKNVVTIPVSVLAVLLRAAFDRSALAEVTFAGLVILLTLTALAVVLRGGFGLGDVKLAGMLSFLLGWTVLSALAFAAFAGGVAAAVVLVRARSRRATLAYGPYLALGGALAILFLKPPHLV